MAKLPMVKQSANELAMDGAIKWGNLWKQGETRKTLRERFFVLRPGCYMYAQPSTVETSECGTVQCTCVLTPCLPACLPTCLPASLSRYYFKKPTDVVPAGIVEVTSYEFVDGNAEGQGEFHGVGRRCSTPALTHTVSNAGWHTDKTKDGFFPFRLQNRDGVGAGRVYHLEAKTSVERDEWRDGFEEMRKTSSQSLHSNPPVCVVHLPNQQPYSCAPLPSLSYCPCTSWLHQRTNSRV